MLSGISGQRLALLERLKTFEGGRERCKSGMAGSALLRSGGRAEGRRLTGGDEGEEYESCANHCVYESVEAGRVVTGRGEGRRIDPSAGLQSNDEVETSPLLENCWIRRKAAGREGRETFVTFGPSQLDGESRFESSDRFLREIGREAATFGLPSTARRLRNGRDSLGSCASLERTRQYLVGLVFCCLDWPWGPPHQ